MNHSKNSFFLFEDVIFRIFSRLLHVWNRFRRPFFNEESTLRRLLMHYPHSAEMFLQKYGINSMQLKQNLPLTLREMTEKFQLPPPQLLFLEIQMSSYWKGIDFLDPKSAKAALDTEKHALILDARDLWERKIADITGSVVLDEEKLSELARSSHRHTPILLFCHFGVRSTDFAVKLKEWGYEKVWVLRGGIDAWAQVVDPEMKRYDGSWC